MKYLPSISSVRNSQWILHQVKLCFRCSVLQIPLCSVGYSSPCNSRETRPLILPQDSNHDVISKSSAIDKMPARTQRLDIWTARCDDCKLILLKHVVLLTSSVTLFILVRRPVLHRLFHHSSYHSYGAIQVLCNAMYGLPLRRCTVQRC